jgi:hypothetical protein
VRTRPNPSLKRSANGRAPGPRSRVVYHRFCGPGVLPSSPAWVERYVNSAAGGCILEFNHIWGIGMATAKEELKSLLEQQPEDSSTEELVRELAFHVMIRRGLADSDAQKTISNEEMGRRIRSWPA